MKAIAKGVWPTMVTPFTPSGNIDYEHLEHLVEWYISKGVHGLFAVCQSSEMFMLSLEEKVKLARAVVEFSAGRVQVIASGHTSDQIADQVEEIKRISETGIDAFVMVSNRLASEKESDEVWKQNMDWILNQVPDVSLGLYECPYPYKRLMSPALLQWCESTGRFLFLKDTCCDLEQLHAKLQALEGTRLQIFNANSATLLQSIKMGAAGFSGVMANFHPQLYVWLVEQWRTQPEKAEQVQDFLGLSSLIESQYYPVNAKYHLQLEGVPIDTYSRVKEADGFKINQRIEVEQLRRHQQYFSRKWM